METQAPYSRTSRRSWAGFFAIIAIVGVVWVGSTQINTTPVDNNPYVPLPGDASYTGPATYSPDSLSTNYGSLQLGSSVADAKAMFGPPDNVQTFESTSGRSMNLYYGDWQFVFRGGVLTAKNKY